MEEKTRRSRRKAQRMLAEKRRGTKHDSPSPTRERAKPPRRKKKEALVEEDVIDGFAILSFKCYEDIETSLKMGKTGSGGTLGASEAVTVTTKSEPPTPPNHRINLIPTDKIMQDPGTSDDSCRERTIKRDPESEDNRLSDASSRCSSGRGYICDSEGEDDKGATKKSVKPTERIEWRPFKRNQIKKVRKSPTIEAKVHWELPKVQKSTKASDTGSVLFSASPPPVRKHEPVDVPIINGHVSSSPRVERRSVSPVVCVPQQPPPAQPPPAAPPPPPPPPPPPQTANHYPVQNGPGLGIVERSPPPIGSPRGSYPPGYPGYPPPPPAAAATSTPATAPAPAPAPAPAYHPPLYAPYNSTPYLPPATAVTHHFHRINRSPVGVKPLTVTTASSLVNTTTTTTSHRDIVSTPLVGRSHSPRGHSPTRERDSYSSNVSSLSRGSVGTPVSLPPFTAAAPPHHPQSSLPYSKPSIWANSSSGGVQGSAPSRHAPSLGHPFPPPMFPTPVPPPAVSTAPAQHTNPIPFSAESLFQSNQGDLLRRELDTRFLVSQDRGPYLRTEMHHHQHQHTHVHQHTTPILPPPPPTLFTPPIFKDIPKIGGVDSPFYRQSLISSYPGYTPGLIHPTLGPSTPFAPPTHLPTFTPKQLTEPTKPKTMKTGKWNAMHVRIAWEIYHHQQKGGNAVLGGETKVGPGLLGKSELLRPPTHMFGPPPTHPFAPTHRAPTFEPTPPPFPSIGGSMFGRYPSTAPFPSLAAFPHAPIHDPWSRLQGRGVSAPGFTTGTPSGPWGLKPDPAEEREREKERERSRERARREEKQRRAAAAAVLAQSKVRERSPLREGQSSKEEEAMRQAHYLAARHQPRPIAPPHYPPSPWDHPYRYDALRFNPLVNVLREEEEQRAKLFGAFGGAPRAKAPSPHTRVPGPHPGYPHAQPKEESSQSR